MHNVATDDDAADFDRFFAETSRDESKRVAESYFTRDCLWIVERAQASPDTFPGIAALVLLSIQQPFVQMPRQIADVAQDGAESQWLFGYKSAGFDFVRRNKRALWESARACHAGKISLDDLILDYLAIPNMGIVKASFLAQMTVGQGACLDTLNLRTMGLSETAFRTPKALKPVSIRKRIATYNAAWRAHGDSAYWWDSWCDLVGNRTHNVRGYKIGGFANGSEVSHVHRLAITGGIK